MKRILILVQILFFVVMVSVAFPNPEKGVKRGADEFYKKVRFIMTKVERDIYKHLPDDAARAEFIKEFWEKRDPTPDNFENEAKAAYYERIAYANRWFSEGKGKGTGWDTERGRILLQLGIPDRREFGEFDYRRNDGSLVSTKRLPMERWFYYRFQLYLVFTDSKGFGNYKLLKIPAQLLTAIDLAKMSIIGSSEFDLKYQLKFKPSIKKKNILIKIPVKKISFRKNDGKMEARFGIVIYTYRDYKKIDEIKDEKVLSDMDESILLKKNIVLKIPIKYEEKGKYIFDIVVEDKVAQARYRDVLKYKLR